MENEVAALQPRISTSAQMNPERRQRDQETLGSTRCSRAERAEFYFEPFCQLAPAFNGRGLFPSMAATSFIRRLERDLAKCRSDLELLESGRMQNRERRDGGAWVDTTQRELDWHKKTIGMYEGLVRKLRAEHGGGDV